MKTITMKKGVLVEKVKSNRDAHRSAYDQAYAGFKAKVEKMVLDTFEASKGMKPEEVKEMVYAIWNLPVPEDHTKDYDTVLAMLTDEIDEDVTVERAEYENYVLDNWSWTGRFVGTNSLYS